MYYKETNGVKITIFINLWKELDVDATDDCSLWAYILKINSVDSQNRLAQTQRKALLPSNLNELLREIS